MTTPAPLPREFMVAVDTQAAAVAVEYGQLDDRLQAIADQAHQQAGDVRKKVTRGEGPWMMDLDDVLAAVPAARVALDEVRAAMVRNNERAMTLHEVWRTHGRWSRFFLVISSDGGHLHGDTSCSRRGSADGRTTAYAWCPDLSGLTEGDAVAAHGPILCTRCFPSAPAAWTVGALPEGACRGSKKRPEGDTRRVGMRTYGKCAECQEGQLINGDGTVRQHPRKLTAAEETAKKALSKARSKVASLVTDELYAASDVERLPRQIADKKADIASAARVSPGGTFVEGARAQLARLEARLATAEKRLRGIRARLAAAREALAALESPAAA